MTTVDIPAILNVQQKFFSIWYTKHSTFLRELHLIISQEYGIGPLNKSKHGDYAEFFEKQLAFNGKSLRVVLFVQQDLQLLTVFDTGKKQETSEKILILMSSVLSPGHNPVEVQHAFNYGTPSDDFVEAVKAVAQMHGSIAALESWPRPATTMTKVA